MTQKRVAVIAALGAAVFVALPEAGHAELFRCKAADGRMIYTDSKALCPGEEPFEPKGELQVAPGTDAAPAAQEHSLAARRARAEARDRAARAEEGEAKRWRDTKAQREGALAEVVRQREKLAEFVTSCNRGGYVVTRDDAGIKRRVSCKKIRADYATLEEFETKARAELAALPEECRRAGCLPGWLR